MEQHVKEELERISVRLSGYPDPFEHAGLYAAQQALSWAAQPDQFKSPYALVTGSAGGSAGCLEESCHPQSSGSAAPIADAS